MAAGWLLTTNGTILDALEIVGMLPAGETASAEDYDMALHALQNILKELPLHGMSWSKITTAPVALAWDSGTPASVPMPVDYYGSPVVSYVVDGQNVDLEIITKATFDALPAPAQTALHPQKLYIAPNNVGYLWPVPTAAPGLVIIYQAVALDVEDSAPPDVVQSWSGGLALWLAYEISPKSPLDRGERADLEKRFLMRRKLMLASLAETAPITFGVVG